MSGGQGVGEAGVKRADETHIPELATFFRRVWDPSASADRVSQAWAREAAANPVEPGRTPPAFVFLKRGEVIGYLSTIPARFLVAGRRQDGYWLKGLWVLPEHRGGPVGYHLVRTAAADLGPLAALAVAAPARRLFEAVDFRDVARPANHVWPLRPLRLFARLDPDRILDEASLRKRVWRLARRLHVAGLAGVAGTGLLRLGRRRTGGQGFTIDERWDTLTGDDADLLWNALAAPGYRGLIRDAAYLRWRYQRRREDGYRPVAVMGDDGRGDRRLLAAAVLRLPTVPSEGRLEGVSVAWLSELLFAPENPRSRMAAHLALDRVEALARRAGGDALALSFAGPGYADLFRERRYLRRSASMHLLVRGLEEEGDAATHLAPRARAGAAEWVVARGDGDSDGLS